MPTKKKTKKAAARKPAPGASFRLDARAYPLEAIRAAAAGFEERAAVALKKAGAAAVDVRLEPRAAGADAEALAGEFHNEVLHETLRLRVSRENRVLRELVVTRALLSAQEERNTLPPLPAPAEEPPRPAEAEPLLDAALESEIDALLAEIDKAGPGAADPLGVAVPWEKRRAEENPGGAEKKETP